MKIVYSLIALALSATPVRAHHPEGHELFEGSFWTFETALIGVTASILILAAAYFYLLTRKSR